LLNDIFQIAIKYHVKLPSDLVMLSKGIVTIEGVCEELYPDFNLIEVSKPYVDKVLKEEINPLSALKRLVKDAFKFKEDIKQFIRALSWEDKNNRINKIIKMFPLFIFPLKILEILFI